jgi:hypothetical protein
LQRKKLWASLTFLSHPHIPSPFTVMCFIPQCFPYVSDKNIKRDPRCPPPFSSAPRKKYDADMAGPIATCKSTAHVDIVSAALLKFEACTMKAFPFYQKGAAWASFIVFILFAAYIIPHVGSHQLIFSSSFRIPPPHPPIILAMTKGCRS